MIRYLILFICAGLLVTAASCSQQSGDEKTEDTTMEKAEAVAVEHPVRSEDNAIFTMETDFGKLTVELYRDVAPAHADSFLARVEEGFFDSTSIHRVVKGFMMQGGNPAAVGRQPVKYSLQAEFNDLPHKEGTLSAARSNDPNSASTQFFICFARNQYTASLDKQYTNFGQLLNGYEALHKIEEVAVGPNKWMGGTEVSAPLEEIMVLRAYKSDAEGNPL